MWSALLWPIRPCRRRSSQIQSSFGAQLAYTFVILELRPRIDSDAAAARIAGVRVDRPARPGPPVRPALAALVLALGLALRLLGVEGGGLVGLGHLAALA